MSITITEIEIVPLVRTINVHIAYSGEASQVSASMELFNPVTGLITPSPDLWVDPITGMIEGSILGVHTQPGTAYVLSIFVSDETGIVLNQDFPINTKPYEPPEGTGNTIIVSTLGDDLTGTGSELQPFRTLQRAQDIAMPGDIIEFRGGIYVDGVTTFSRSGISSAWITVKPRIAESVVLEGGSRGKSQTSILEFTENDGLFPSYWHVKDIELRDAVRHAVEIAGFGGTLAPEKIQFTRLNIQTYGLLQEGFGFLIQQGAEDIRIAGSNIRTSHNTNIAVAVRLWRHRGQLQFYDNVVDLAGVTGKADGISSGPARETPSGMTRDSEAWSNLFKNITDNAVEFDGTTAIGCHAFLNTSIDVFMDYSIQEGPRGPIWIYRNRAYTSLDYESPFWPSTDPGAFLKYGGNGAGPYHIYHNTAIFESLSLSGENGLVRTNSGVHQNQFIKNNILRMTRYVYGNSVTLDSDANYNYLYTTDPTRFVKAGIKYTFTQWQALGKDLNSISLPDPMLVDPAGGNFDPVPGSPVIGRGVEILGVNHDFLGGAPNIGAVETPGEVEPIPPVAAFEVSPESGFAPLQVTLTNLSTGDFTGFTWDMGDGKIFVDQDPPVPYIYITPGLYDVTLSITGIGDFLEASLVIEVLDPAVPPPPKGGLSTGAVLAIATASAAAVGGLIIATRKQSR